jgi:hypothetical protein
VEKSGFFYEHEVLFFHENEWKKVKWVKKSKMGEKKSFFHAFHFFSRIFEKQKHLFD